jgi:hypothetical protein
VLASESTLQADKAAYIPVAGPWMDLAQRPAACTPTTCSGEIGTRTLLVATGIVQAAGALQLLVGLVALAADGSSQTAKVETKPSLHVTPAQVGAGGYGLAALGRF